MHSRHPGRIKGIIETIKARQCATRGLGGRQRRSSRRRRQRYALWGPGNDVLAGGPGNDLLCCGRRHDMSLSTHRSGIVPRFVELGGTSVADISKLGGL
jgi:hypothetical protein